MLHEHNPGNYHCCCLDNNIRQREGRYSDDIWAGQADHLQSDHHPRHGARFWHIRVWSFGLIHTVGQSACHQNWWVYLSLVYHCDQIETGNLYRHVYNNIYNIPTLKLWFGGIANIESEPQTISLMKFLCAYLSLVKMVK